MPGSSPGKTTYDRFTINKSYIVVIIAMRYAYLYVLHPQPEGDVTVTFPDVPEAITQGDSEEEAATMAEDAPVTALSFHMDKAERLPRPSPAEGRPLAYLPPLVAAKLALHDAMIIAGVSNVALARQLGTDEKTVRRLRDPLHQSRINQVDAALRVLGKRMGIAIEAA
jgi:antitoxin HicB